MKLKIFLLTLVFTITSQAGQLSKKEKECYASIPILISGIERFSPVLANYTSRLFFHLIEYRKLSSCEAKKEIKEILNSIKR